MTTYFGHFGFFHYEMFPQLLHSEAKAAVEVDGVLDKIVLERKHYLVSLQCDICVLFYFYTKNK